MGTRKGFTIWFTGLPCSGKTTLANALKPELEALGTGEVEVLDGDVVRTHISKGLGFSRDDRDTHIRRIGWIAALLTKHGVVNIVAVVSPYKSTRNEAREMGGQFVEVYSKCSLEECERRDVKGMYKKARAGEIRGFTGVDDPYEPPDNPELVLETDRLTVAQCVNRVLHALDQEGLLRRGP